MKIGTTLRAIDIIIMSKKLIPIILTTTKNKSDDKTFAKKTIQYKIFKVKI